MAGCADRCGGRALRCYVRLRPSACAGIAERPGIAGSSSLNPAGPRHVVHVERFPLGRRNISKFLSRGWRARCTQSSPCSRRRQRPACRQARHGPRAPRPPDGPRTAARGEPAGHDARTARWPRMGAPPARGRGQGSNEPVPMPCRAIASGALPTGGKGRVPRRWRHQDAAPACYARTHRSLVGASTAHHGRPPSRATSS
jgi:hypothetical protein